ncbi:hypothetical protein APSETT445_002231 [Aspergillus pseudonomiae]
MIWGDNFCIFKPNVPRGHDEYNIKILAKYHIYFGPFAPSYGEPADEETLAILSLIMKDVPPEKLRPFSLASQKEISQQDKEFLLKIMKLDPRDRPTAKDLIEDECAWEHALTAKIGLGAKTVAGLKIFREDSRAKSSSLDHHQMRLCSRPM